MIDIGLWSSFLSECIRNLANHSHDLACFAIKSLEVEVSAALVDQYGETAKQFCRFSQDILKEFTTNHNGMLNLEKKIREMINNSVELLLEITALPATNFWPGNSKLIKELEMRDMKKNAQFFLANINPILAHIENCMHIEFGMMLNEVSKFFIYKLGNMSEKIIPEANENDLKQINMEIEQCDRVLENIIKARRDIQFQKNPQTSNSNSGFFSSLWKW